MHNTIGVLGGGQLALMLAEAAKELDCHVVVFGDKSADNVAFKVADHAICNGFTQGALEYMAQVLKGGPVLLEFENIPIEAVEYLCKLGVEVCPGPHILRIAQDRFLEKASARSHGIETTTYCNAVDAYDFSRETGRHCFPGIVKTARDGYDGKGQYPVADIDELRALVPTLKRVPYILEKRVDLAYEISVIVVRNKQGEVRVLPPTINTHEHGILRETLYEKDKINGKVRVEAQEAAIAMASGLKLIGPLAVEFFVTTEGQLLFNEMAPRPHNSGHWTIEGCETSQFTLAVQAALGMPMGKVTPKSDRVRMINLLGSDVDCAARHRECGGHVHLYGKKDAKPGRKMGHVTFVAYEPELVS